ncbi:hypothetical protein [Bacillus subtilis]|uniref:hypothetical protein n=1 Tax=Bacillus subtilis TaxID=1423 RepID=UPI001A947555|nr:hypothetical protein [Bacillus subtilis]
MLKIRGSGTTDAVKTHKSSAHSNYFQMRWIIVDVSNPNAPVQVDRSTLTGSPTLDIERQFVPGSNDYWEPFDVNPIDLKQAKGVANTYIEGGVFRYTVKNLDNKYEVWLNPMHISL